MKKGISRQNLGHKIIRPLSLKSHSLLFLDISIFERHLCQPPMTRWDFQLEFLHLLRNYPWSFWHNMMNWCLLFDITWPQLYNISLFFSLPLGLLIPWFFCLIMVHISPNGIKFLPQEITVLKMDLYLYHQYELLNCWNRSIVCSGVFDA